MLRSSRPCRAASVIPGYRLDLSGYRIDLNRSILAVFPIDFDQVISDAVRLDQVDVIDFSAHGLERDSRCFLFRNPLLGLRLRLRCRGRLLFIRLYGWRLRFRLWCGLYSGHPADVSFILLNFDFIRSRSQFHRNPVGVRKLADFHDFAPIHFLHFAGRFGRRQRLGKGDQANKLPDHNGEERDYGCA